MTGPVGSRTTSRVGSVAGVVRTAVLRRLRAVGPSGPAGARAISTSAILLRVVVLAAGWGSLLLAVPTPVLGYAPLVVVVVAGVLAAAATVVPRRHAALILELGVVGLWLLPGGHPGPTAVAAIVLAAVLFAHHAAAALAAATGWDVRATREFARGSTMRTAGTIVAASVVSVVMLVLTGRSDLVLPDVVLVAGLVAAVFAVAVPLVGLRRARRVSDPVVRTLD